MDMGWMHMKSRMQPARMMRILSEDAGVYEQELLLASRFSKAQKQLQRHGSVKIGTAAEKS